jgi:hypothetical protein
MTSIRTRQGTALSLCFGQAETGSGNPRFLFFHFPLFILGLAALIVAAGCASPGDPNPPQPPVPQAITDLAAHQAGDKVVLVFTIPKSTVEGEPLSEPPTIEIFRSYIPSNAKLKNGLPVDFPKEPSYTIPSALVSTYEADGRMTFDDPLKPEDLLQHSGEQVVYLVRARASKKKDSDASNPASVRVYPAAEPIGNLAAQMTKTAVELSWAPPAKTTSGAPIAALTGYRVYRSEVDPKAATEAMTDPSTAKTVAPLELLALTPSPHYGDSQFQFGRTYLYSVRSVTQYEADSVESGDSNLLAVMPRDVFPPAAPQDLVSVLVPASGATPAHLELSWSISDAPDVTGYNFYRSEDAAKLGERLNRDLLPTPAFRDMSAVPGRTYSYTVTAVDRAGNESLPSAPVSVTVPAEARKMNP